MNVEIIVFVLLVIITVLSLVLLVWLSYGSYLKWCAANRRANELLRSVLTRQQYRHLVQYGYLDIPSPRDPGCIYRVPRCARAGGSDRAGETQGESVPATRWRWCPMPIS